jgi:hypothetical protein
MCETESFTARFIAPALKPQRSPLTRAALEYVD